MNQTQRVTEEVDVKLVNGELSKVHLHLFIDFKQKQDLLNCLTKNKSLSQLKTAEDFELETVNEAMYKLATYLWSPKNTVRLEDVEADSLSELLQERFNKFLSGSGFQASA